jgi:hypothetical protein
MGANPASPINLVKKPVHYDEKHDDCEQAGRGLQIESRHVVAERTDDPHCNQPRDQTGDKRKTRTERDRTAMGPLRTCHARSDRCQNQNAFQSLAKDKNSNVQKRHRGAGIGACWIRGAVSSNSLPHKHRDHEKRSYDDADAQSWLHFASNFITCQRRCCRLIAFF